MIFTHLKEVRISYKSIALLPNGSVISKVESSGRCAPVRDRTATKIWDNSINFNIVPLHCRNHKIGKADFPVDWISSKDVSVTHIVNV